MAESAADLDDENMAMLLALGEDDEGGEVVDTRDRGEPERIDRVEETKATVSNRHRKEAQQVARRGTASGFELMGKQAIKRKATAPPGLGDLGSTRQHAAESLSGIRLKSPIMSGMVVSERATCFPYVKMSQIRKTKPELFEGVWSTIAVVVEKGLPKESQKGSKFLTLKVGDLEENVYSLALFGDAFAEHWKLDLGSLILIMGAKMRPPQDEGMRRSGSSDSFPMSFSVNQGEQISKIGTSKDFSTCKGTRRDGTACTMPVNLSVCEYCKYHAASALKKLKVKSKAKSASVMKMVRPEMGGSNFYALHAKNLGQQERRKYALEQTRSTLREYKRSASTARAELVSFTDKCSELMPHRRGVGALQAVVAKTEFQEKENRPIPTNENAKAGRGGGASGARASSPEMIQLSSLGNNVGSGGGAGAYAKAVAFVQSIGGLKAPNPNDTSGIRMHDTLNQTLDKHKKSAAPTGITGAKEAPKREAGTGDKPAFLVEKEMKAKHSRNAFLSSFSQTRKACQANNGALPKSLYEREADEEDLNDALRKVNGLEKKEELTDQLTSTQQIEVRCFHCKQCRRLTEKKPSTCFDKGHTVARVKTHKKFWQCTKCKRRATTLGQNVHYPKGGCAKCGGSQFTRSGIISAPSVKLTSVASKEGFKARGEEHAKFLRSNKI